MLHFSSFTKTWISFFSGEVSRSALQSSTMQFGCTRCHLFPTQYEIDAIGCESFPIEASWVNAMQSLQGERAPAALFPKSVASKFREFLEIVKDLEEQGKVTFRGAPDSVSGQGYSDDLAHRFHNAWGRVVSRLKARQVVVNGSNVGEIIECHVAKGRPYYVIRFLVRWRGFDGDIERWFDLDEVQYYV